MTTQIFKKHITDNWTSGVKVIKRKRKLLNQQKVAQKIVEDEMADFDRDMQADEAAE
jgi:hypothetical protein